MRSTNSPPTRWVHPTIPRYDGVGDRFSRYPIFSSFNPIIHLPDPILSLIILIWKTALHDTTPRSRNPRMRAFS
jgi:hypothetical protein